MSFSVLNIKIVTIKTSQYLSRLIIYQYIQSHVYRLCHTIFITTLQVKPLVFSKNLWQFAGDNNLQLVELN